MKISKNAPADVAGTAEAANEILAKSSRLHPHHITPTRQTTAPLSEIMKHEDERISYPIIYSQVIPPGLPLIALIHGVPSDHKLPDYLNKLISSVTMSQKGGGHE